VVNKVTSATNQSLVRLLTRVGLTFVAVLWFVPAVADAGCGDHLYRLPDSHQPSLHVSSPLALEPTSAPMVPKPCSGPHCSENRQPMTPAPAPAPTSGTPEWACVLDWRHDLDSSSAARSSDDLSQRPVRRIASVYHPPRA
jgi:hypothetical protein